MNLRSIRRHRRRGSSSAARAVRALVIVGGMCVAGCSQPQRVGALAPSHAELPSFPALEPSIAADIAVEGAPPYPLGTLVSNAPPPELTEEERAKLGPEPPKINFLELYSPAPTPKQGVSPIEGGIATARYGTGGASVAACPASAIVGQAGINEYPTVSYPGVGARIGMTGEVGPAEGFGPEGLPRIGINPPSRIASRKTYVRP